ncbi:non-ribosomal peptide synthetase [Streptomyces sp. 4.24]|uniref:non-ribosomal peptide synthetase n=1 Tax=Streptomyces tritrimontium TaxID=3406573 RepID=UPI003BB4AB8C
MFTARSQLWTITAQYLDRYRQHVPDRTAPGGTGPAPGFPLPVTGAQRRFLLARLLTSHGRPDLVPLFFVLPRGAVDPVRLGSAAAYVAARHPVLRTRAAVLGGVPVLRTTEPEEPSAYVTQVRGTGRGGTDSRDDALRAALADWQPGPPLRLFLAAATDDSALRGDGDGSDSDSDDGREVLALVLDHAVCDEQSLGVVIGDLAEAYTFDLGAHDLPGSHAADALAVYRDAVHRQLDAEHRASTGSALSYWAERLAGAPLPGPADAAGPREDSGVLRATLPSGSGSGTGTGSGSGSADGHGRLFPALLGACDRAARALHGYGPRDPAPLLGYPWGGRPPGAEGLVGCFLNTVPYRVPGPDADPDAAFATWCADLDHAGTPFDEIVRAARSAGLPWNGGFHALLTYEDRARRPALRLGRAVGSETHVDGRPLQAPLTVSVSHGSAHGAEPVVRMAWERGAFPRRAGHRAEVTAFAALLDALPAGA